jgi:hypothetical protein
MPRALTRSGLYILLVFALVSLISGALWAGQNRGRFRTSVAPGKFAAGRSFVHGGPIYPYGYPYWYGRYQPYYPPLVVISPYAGFYYAQPTIVVTEPYLCVFHNEGYVSRVGLLDHLAGTHKVSLDAAASLCPAGATTCIFPSY